MGNLDEEEFHVPQLHDDDEEGDSDKELEVAFKAGLLKPGMFRPITAPPPEINDTEGILQKLEDMKQLDLDWVERLDVTVQAKRDGSDDNDEFDVHNDFQREISFYEQAKDSMLFALKKLHAAGIATKRPDDYFAEMAKKDDHMKRVREKLLSLRRRRETIEKNKSNYKLKKYGKQVQQAVAKERLQKKKEMMSAVKKYQKGKTDKLDFLEDETATTAPRKKPSQLQRLQQQNKLNPKRSYKNKKFGFGGKKKGTKSNTKKSFNSVAGKFKKNIHGGGGASKGRGGKNKRPGKSKRAAGKTRR